MRTRLSVSSWLLGVECTIVSFVFGRWPQAEAVHDPGLVVPAGPVRSEELDVGEPGQWAAPERGIIADRFGFVEPDRGLGQGVILGVTDGPDRRPKIRNR